MTWLSWRLFRLRAVIGMLAVAALGVALAATGPQLAHLSAVSSGAMRFLIAEYSDTADKTLYLGGAAAVLAAPALLGIFWGAPLISREAETGTYKLAWSQSVSKERWLAAKLAIAGLSAMALAGLLSLALTWWAGPIDRATAMLGAGPGAEAIRFNPVIFATRGVVPVAYAAFAFMLGVAFGVLIRRTVPAMAATLATYTFVQVAWPLWVRAHLIAPVTRLFSPTAVTFSGIGQTHSKLFMNVSGSAGNWVLGSQPVTASGHPTSILPAACHNNNFGPACLASHGIRVAVTYQPASRFWEIQWTETVIFLAAALALVGFCAWWLHRRRLS